MSHDAPHAIDLDDLDWMPPVDDVPPPPHDGVMPRRLPEAEAVDVSELAISERMKDLIVDGWRQGNGYPSRSEADAAVCAALLGAGCSDAQIRYVFEGFPIGAKYHERGNGPRYLARTIASARGAMRPAETIAPTTDAATDAEPYRLLALDWPTLVADGLPEVEMLWAPDIPRGARLLAVGAAESGKSFYALWIECQLSRRGTRCVYISQENPLVEDVRRLARLRPDWEHLRFFHDQGLDLSIPEHVAALIEASDGAGLITLDTLSACWSGAEDDNREIAAFDRDVLARVVRETGASVLVLDHTGNPQSFVRRRGVHAPRGASTKAQKADVVLEIIAEGPSAFRVEVAKNRLGGVKPPPRLFRVVDTDDDGLEIVEEEIPPDAKVTDLAERIVGLVSEAGALTTKKLRAAAGGGREAQDRAFALLAQEDPGRVRAAFETIETDRGRQRAKVWRPAGGELS